MAQNNTIPDTGQFTPEERERQTRAALERKGNLIVEAGRNGISVHAFDSNSDSVSFPDPERFVLNHPVTREIEQDFARERGLHTLAEQFEFGRRNPEEVTNYFQERFNRQPELRERIGNDYTQALRDFQRARTADDQTMGTAILQQTQGRRTAVIVGGAHDALGQALGPDTLEIGIYTNQEARQQALEVGRVLMEREHREPREPHVTTFVEEGRSYFTRQPSPSIERAYGFSSMGSTEPITVARNDPSLNQAIEEARRAIPSPNMQSHSAHDDPNHGTQGGRAPSQQRHH
ncbi:MAG: hypothetical protein K2Q12_05705 [Rickettsiales bacterium]|nr:hypothetical protein [Rickettsiales bacterium]